MYFGLRKSGCRGIICLAVGLQIAAVYALTDNGWCHPMCLNNKKLPLVEEIIVQSTQSSTRISHEVLQMNVVKGVTAGPL